MHALKACSLVPHLLYRVCKLCPCKAMQYLWVVFPQCYCLLSSTHHSPSHPDRFDYLDICLKLLASPQTVAPKSVCVEACITISYFFIAHNVFYGVDVAHFISPIFVQMHVFITLVENLSELHFHLDALLFLETFFSSLPSGQQYTKMASIFTT